MFFNTVGSTNDVASTLAAQGVEGAVVIADEQTAGRGRRGRTWFSPPGSGLYISVVLTLARARVDRDRAMALLTLAAGVALAEAVEAVTGLSIEIKWPNDLLLGGRKLGGILAEAVASNARPAAMGNDGAPRGRSVLDTHERNGASASASGSGGVPAAMSNDGDTVEREQLGKHA